MSSDLFGWFTGILTLVLMISVLVVAHEWGHFAAAKFFGMRVEDFSLFFGPVIWRVGKRGDTVYNVRAYPLGGFVKISGMEPDDISSGQPILQAVRSSVKSAVENDPLSRLLTTLDKEGIVSIAPDSIGEPVRDALRDAFGQDGQMTASGRADLEALKLSPLLTDGEHTLIDMALHADERSLDGALYLNRPIYQRALVIFAGPLASLLTGFILFCVMGMAVGLPDKPTNQVAYVRPGMPAQKAGMRIGDRILAIDGTTVPDGEWMMKKINGSKGKRLALTVERDNQTLTMLATPVAGEDAKGRPTVEGFIGITPNFDLRRAGPVESVVTGTRYTYLSMGLLLTVLQRRHADDVGGPIMMGQMTTALQKVGIAHLLTMASGLSLSLGVMNLLPIPILDGGHLMLLALEKLRRRKLSLREMVGAQMVGLGLIALLVVFVMYNDIARTIAGNAPK